MKYKYEILEPLTEKEIIELNEDVQKANDDFNKLPSKLKRLPDLIKKRTVIQQVLLLGDSGIITINYSKEDKTLEVDFNQYLYDFIKMFSNNGIVERYMKWRNIDFDEAFLESRMTKAVKKNLKSKVGKIIK